MPGRKDVLYTDIKYQYAGNRQETYFTSIFKNIGHTASINIARIGMTAAKRAVFPTSCPIKRENPTEAAT